MINRVLIFGYNSAGQKHLLPIKKILPASKIKVFVRKVKDSKNDYITKLNEIKIFRPQLSIVANPSSQRLNICRFLIKNKSNILIEKPLSSNLSDAKKIFNLSKKNRNIIRIGYNLRQLSSLQYIKNIIKKKKLGKINFIRAEVGKYLPDWRNVNYRRSVSSSKKLGGGVLNELSHEIDYLQWIFGGFYSVFCDIQKRSNLKINVEDIANIILFLKNGTPINLSLDFCRRDNKRALYISGEKNSLKWDGIKNQINFFNPKKNKWSKILLKKENILSTYLKQIKNIVGIINKNDLNKKNVISNVKSAFQVTKIINYARQSSLKKKLIYIK